MIEISHSSNLYSHPGKLLEDHLIGVAKLTKIFLKEKPWIIQRKIENVVFFAGLFHDIGKATSFFQNYLFSNNEKSGNEKTRHSLLSSIFWLYFSFSLLNAWEIFLVYYLIRHHHSNLSNPLNIFSIERTEIDYLLEQIDSIDSAKFFILLQKLSSFCPMLEQIFKSFNFENLKNYCKNLESVFLCLKRLVSKKLRLSNIENYIDLNLASSILLDADKSDVVVKDFSLFTSRKPLDGKMIDRTIAELQNKNLTINTLRNRAYNEINLKLDSIVNQNHRVFSINLPTGLGKTLSSLSFAIKLREKLAKNHRIIYCLPFLSIIDQNFQVILDILEKNDIPASTDVLLKHHHLSEISYKKSGLQQEFDTDISRILIEGWNSEIIVTTFVQLFHTVITNSNRNVRKFHRLANSIIILDEIQAIPVKYWNLVNNVLTEIAYNLNSYIILVTATQPLIFNKDEVLPLVDIEQYIGNLNRIKLIANLTPIELDDFLLNFTFDNRKYLFILNTINSAKQFYKKIKEKVNSSILLTTHIIPCHRLQRIDNIKRGKYNVVVSTQLIEAGVDIDLDVVVRDFAPLDSVIQSAGRCNRNSLAAGEISLVRFIDENQRILASYVYDPILLEITKEIFSGKQEYSEPELYELTKRYFEETNKKKSQSASDALIEAICKLIYITDNPDIYSIRDFTLIDEDLQKIDVFIEFDENAKQIWDKFQSIYKIDDKFSRKKEFDKIKNIFYDYVISIPKYAKNQPEQFFGDLGYIPNHLVKYYYDIETGYKLEEEESVVVF